MQNFYRTKANPENSSFECPVATSRMSVSFLVYPWREKNNNNRRGDLKVLSHKQLACKGNIFHQQVFNCKSTDKSHFQDTVFAVPEVVRFPRGTPSS